jgi:hypothetical protein
MHVDVGDSQDPLLTAVTNYFMPDNPIPDDGHQGPATASSAHVAGAQVCYGRRSNTRHALCS